jgi:Putative adhesin
MQGDPREGPDAYVPRPDGPPEVPSPEQQATQPTPPTYPPYPPYPPYSSQQPYYPAPPIYAPPPGPMPRKGVPWYLWLIGGCLALVLLVTGACVVLGVAMDNLFITLANEKTATDNGSQSFTVTGTPSIVLHDTVGTITIQTGSAGSVLVQTTRTARDTTSQAAQSDLADITVTETQSGGTITIETQTSGTSSITRQLDADFIITVPPTANLDLETDVGDVSTEGVTFAGSSRIVATTGTVDVSGSLGESASLDVEVTTGDARLTLPSATSAHLDASTNTGSVNLTGWSVPVTQHGLGATATGDLGTAPQAQLTIRVTTGSIDISAG